MIHPFVSFALCIAVLAATILVLAFLGDWIERKLEDHR